MVRASILVAALHLVAAGPAFSSPEKPGVGVSAQAGRSAVRVLLTTADGREATAAIHEAGGTAGRFLARSGSQVAFVPPEAIQRLAARPDILSIRFDRPIRGAMDVAARTLGAEWVREQLGFDGSGVGVAIVDSGVVNWHDDLGSTTVVDFVDFVSGLATPHDDYGHGTHVAGTIAGNGYDSGGARRGVAPGAHLLVLKVLDRDGAGHTSDVIAAIDYAIEHRQRYNIRIINLSVVSGVYESYTTDPLTLAAARAVEAGIVVVTAAGNLGRGATGTLYGGITSPGNAPWVITVGAADHRNTAIRSDDTVAPFSSRGPTHIDRAVKPDLLAPGVGIESLAAADSALYQLHPDARIRGTVDTIADPYLSLTGTSMAAPLVTGTIALMIEANPALTPNLVKAVLQFTAERRPGIEHAAQGAGMLNSRGAVQVAVSLAGGDPGPSDPTRWSRLIYWGNKRIRGGTFSADASAWRTDVAWGAATTPEGDDISWGQRNDGNGRWRAPATDFSTLDIPLDEIAWTSAAARDLAWAASAPRPRAIDTGKLPSWMILDRALSRRVLVQ